VTFQTHLLRGNPYDTIRVVEGDGTLPKARRERWAWRLQLLAVGIVPAVILVRSFDGDVRGWWVILVVALVVLVLAALAHRSFSSSLRMFSDRLAADPDADFVMPVRATADLSVFPLGYGHRMRSGSPSSDPG
jgi:cation transporter-like permease